MSDQPDPDPATVLAAVQGTISQWRRGAMPAMHAARAIAGMQAAVDVYDAALAVLAKRLDLSPGTRLLALDRELDALRVALERVGVLERDDRLDPAAVSRLSPRRRPDPPGVIGSAPGGG